MIKRLCYEVQNEEKYVRWWSEEAELYGAPQADNKKINKSATILSFVREAISQLKITGSKLQPWMCCLFFDESYTCI